MFFEDFKQTSIESWSILSSIECFWLRNINDTWRKFLNRSTFVSPGQQILLKFDLIFERFTFLCFLLRCDITQKPCEETQLCWM
jgi:hypothetical protein